MAKKRQPRTADGIVAGCKVGDVWEPGENTTATDEALRLLAREGLVPVYIGTTAYMLPNDPTVAGLCRAFADGDSVAGGALSDYLMERGIPRPPAIIGLSPSRLVPCNQDAKTNLYERIQEACDLFDDPDWRSRQGLIDDDAASRYLTETSFPDLSSFVNFLELYDLYTRYDEATWRRHRYDVQRLRAERETERRGARGEAPRQRQPKVTREALNDAIEERDFFRSRLDKAAQRAEEAESKAKEAHREKKEANQKLRSAESVKYADPRILEAHELAKKFPPMNEEDFARLKASIEKAGRIEASDPLWLHEGKIVDGLNRQRAAIELKLPLVPTREWDGVGSLVDFVVRRNLARRHLTGGQKAILAAELLPDLEREAKDRQRAAGGDKKSETAREKPLSQNVDTPIPPPTRVAGRATEQAARITGTNRQSVADAKKLLDEAPDKAEEVKAGKKSLPQAKKEIKAEASPAKPSSSEPEPKPFDVRNDVRRINRFVREMVGNWQTNEDRLAIRNCLNNLAAEVVLGQRTE